MKVLVTGGAGFIGSGLVRGLLARGDEVRVLDNFSAGKRENLEGVAGRLEVIEGDIRDRATCKSACRGVEAVLHQAAVGSVPLSIEDPLGTNDVNVTGTLNMLLAAREAGARRFVFASSSSVYGNSPDRVKDEAQLPRPESPYAISKLAGEAYTVVFHKVYSLETVPLRYFNIFGPRQDPESMYAAVIPRFATALLEGRPPRVFGDGGQTRDFTFVDNVVRANILGLTCPSAACGRPYNVACGVSTSLLELFRLLREQVGGVAARIEPVHEPPQKGDVRDSLASIRAAREGLGYTVDVDVAEGLRRTVDWYRSQARERGKGRANG